MKVMSEIIILQITLFLLLQITCAKGSRIIYDRPQHLVFYNLSTTIVSTFFLSDKDIAAGCR